jgi:hypothetical protein
MDWLVYRGRLAGRIRRARLFEDVCVIHLWLSPIETVALLGVDSVVIFL